MIDRLKNWREWDYRLVVIFILLRSILAVTVGIVFFVFLKQLPGTLPSIGVGALIILIYFNNILLSLTEYQLYLVKKNDKETK